MNSTMQHLNELANTLNLIVVEELIVIYSEQIEEAKREFKKYLIDFQADQIAFLSHKMKSSSRNIGAIELAELFDSIEKNPLLLTEMSYKRMLTLFANCQTSIKEWRLLNGT